MNLTLYRKELKGSWKLLVIFAAILTMYISMIISMYDPEMADALKQFEELMPELMAAVGMVGGQDTLMGFMTSYLYGMILLVFPMVYIIIRANGLIAKYVDQGSMAALLAAPVKRSRVAFTQWMVLVTGIVLLAAYSTALEWFVSEGMFPGELELRQLLQVNGGLLCLHLFIGGFCFLCSCLFSEAKLSLTFGAGIPVLMYILQMLANMGGKLEKIKYATFFTLFQAEGLAAGEEQAFLFAGILLLAAFVCSVAGILVFRSKDLHL